MSAASISTIQASVAERFGVTLQDLLSPSQRRGISRARHVAMRLARQEGYSLRMIGYWFRRDHTTVRQALERMKLMQGDAL